MSILHDFRGGVEISRARVIAEALPRVEDVVFRGRRECSEIGEAAEPLTIIRENGGDLGLLEHELGYENRVRVAGASPGKIAAVFAEPTRERGAELLNIDCRSWLNHDLIVEA